MAVAPAAATASQWPMAGGGDVRAGESPARDELPAAPAWSFAGEDVTTPPIVTYGASPSEQRVVYGTADGRVRFRRLDTGTEVGPAGGTLVADAAVTDQAAALHSAFAATGDVVFVVHDDGGGVEIARFDAATGERLGADVAVPSSLGCREIGAPLLTPTAPDGTHLLFFTMAGNCTAGTGLVRFGVFARGGVQPAGVAEIDALGAASPAFVSTGSGYSIAVGRVGGVEVRTALSDMSAPADAVLPLPAGELPVALSGDGFENLHVLTAAGSDARVHSIDLLRATSVAMNLAGAPRGLAGGERVAVATTAGLTILTDDLVFIGTSPGAASAPSIAGAYALTGDRAVRLEDAGTRPLPVTGAVQPAIARGFVSYGSTTLLTRDATAPSITVSPDSISATVDDDRGVARVILRVGPYRTRTGPVDPFGATEYTGRPVSVPPGRWRIRVVAADRAGNVGRDTGGLYTVPCGRRAMGGPGADILRGTGKQDCLSGRDGPDRLFATAGGADLISCGPGRDRVDADRLDRVAGDCERIRRHRP